MSVYRFKWIPFADEELTKVELVSVRYSNLQDDVLLGYPGWKLGHGGGLAHASLPPNIVEQPDLWNIDDPERDGFYLVNLNNQTYSSCFRSSILLYKSDRCRWLAVPQNYTVCGWMPLPRPYKEEQK